MARTRGCARLQRPPIMYSSVRKRKFGNNFMCELFKSQNQSDVIFVVGEERIPAHKMIITARSEVFKTMFDSPLSESLNGEIVITDFSAKTVHDFLHFLYNDSLEPVEIVTEVFERENPEHENCCSLNFQECLDLIDMGRKYLVNDIIPVCEDQMTSLIKNEELLSALVNHVKLSDEKDLKNLKKNCFSEIRKFVLMNFDNENIDEEMKYLCKTETEKGMKYSISFLADVLGPRLFTEFALFTAVNLSAKEEDD